MFVYLDESGDLGFDWSKSNTSLFFTVTILICYNKDIADKVRQAAKRTIRNKLNHKKSKRKNKELKGASTTSKIKEYFYNLLPKTGWNIYSVTLNKKRVEEHLKTKTGKKKLYNFLARFIIEKTQIKNSTAHVNLILDKCKNKEEIKDFNIYIENQVGAILPLNTRLNITHESSSENPCLQAVDLFCWGIARKYKDKDESWYKIFSKMVKYDEIYLPTK